MKVELDDNLYRVDFHKNRRKIRVNGKERDLIDTDCVIFLLKYKEMDCKFQLGYGTAKQNPCDRYNKFVGKRVALQKALQKILYFFPLSGKKERRKRFWEAFYETFKRWN